MAKNTGKSRTPRAPFTTPDAPVLTLTETPAFRVRMSGSGSGRVPSFKRFAGKVRALVRQHGGGGARRFARALGGAGRGAAARLAVRTMRQRVIVKARIVRHSRYGGAAGAGAALDKHLGYLGRRGAGEGGEVGILFDADGEVSPDARRAFREALGEDRHHFRFIVSPQAGGDLDLPRFARELVAEMQVDLGTPLEWVGAAHYDTDDPHVHLLVRGRDAAGGDLVMNRDYLSHGMRLQAMEVATRHLGPRRTEEIEKSLAHELKADRLIALDRSIAAQAARDPRGWVTALRTPEGSLAEESGRRALLTRLSHLEGLGLARELAPGVWEPSPELVPRLAHLTDQRATLALVRAHWPEADSAMPIVMLNKEAMMGAPVIGRVIARGVRDELTDAPFLLVEGLDARGYYVPLGAYSERAGEEARSGAIVRVSAALRHEARAADRNILAVSSANGGIYDAALHADRARAVRLPQGVTLEDYLDSHAKRLRGLASRGLITPIGDSRYEVPADLLTRVTPAAAARDAGGFIRIERLSPQALEQQTRTLGITWLDRELAAGARAEAHERGGEGLGAGRFAGEYRGALRERAAFLAERNLATVDEGAIRLRAGFLEDLYSAEWQEAARRIEERHGPITRLATGERFAGRVEAIEQLPSGAHALIVGDNRATLVPATRALTEQRGQRVRLRLAPPSPERPIPHVHLEGLVPRHGFHRG